MSWWDAVVDYASSEEGMSTIFDGILGGIEGYSNARGSEEQERTRGRYGLRGVREQGEQTRRTAEYAAQLQDHYAELNRERRRTGLGNFARYARNDYSRENFYRPAPVGPTPTASQYDSQFDIDTGRPRGG